MKFSSLIVFQLLFLLSTGMINNCMFYFNFFNATGYMLCDGNYTIADAIFQCDLNGYTLAQNAPINNGVNTILDMFTNIYS